MNIDEMVKIVKLVHDYFNGNSQKTLTWFITENPLLGGISPMDMILNGRHEKLELFVKNLLDENNA